MKPDPVSDLIHIELCELRLVEDRIRRCRRLVREQAIRVAKGKRDDTAEESERLLLNLRMSLVALRDIQRILVYEMDATPIAAARDSQTDANSQQIPATALDSGD